MAWVRFPDGTTVEAVGLADRHPDKADRDYRLYLDARWRPTWNADVIEWEDFGLPADCEAAADGIRKAFGREPVKESQIAMSERGGLTTAHGGAQLAQRCARRKRGGPCEPPRASPGTEGANTGAPRAPHPL
jgi:hypothetical protein